MVEVSRVPVQRCEHAQKALFDRSGPHLHAVVCTRSHRRPIVSLSTSGRNGCGHDGSSLAITVKVIIAAGPVQWDGYLRVSTKLERVSVRRAELTGTQKLRRSWRSEHKNGDRVRWESMMATKGVGGAERTSWTQ